MSEALKRFFTKKPETPLDFFVTWIAISAVPFIVIPIVGVVQGDAGQAIADNWVMFVVVPLAAAGVLIGAHRMQNKRKYSE